MLSLPSPFALMSGPLAAPPLLLLSPLSSPPPPQDAATSARASTAATTATASSALRLVARTLLIRTPLLCCADDTGVVTLPREPHGPAAKRLGVVEGGARVLADDDQLAAGVERHHEPR